VASVDAEYDFKVIEENIGPLMVHFPAMYESLDTARKAGTELDYQALPPPLHRFSPEERALELVRWSGGVFTVGDFVKSLWDIDLDYWPTIGDVKKISTQVIRRMTRWAYMEVTKKAGVLEDPDFKPEIDRKIDELLLNRFHDEHLKAHADRVTDEMVARYWEANQAKYVTQDLVGYGFIRFPGDARELAQRTYEAIRGGQDWSMAANTARRQDERVVFEAMLDPTSGPPYPEITAVAMNYEPAPQGATITEPVQAGGDWVLLRVYYRSHPNTLTFEVAKDFVKRDLQRLEMEDTLLEAIERLTKEFKLEVNEQALS